MTSTQNLVRGKDYIGVGVGAAIINDEGEILLSLRGPKARNERGKWEIPGGCVEFGETFEEAIVREVKEELGIEIKVLDLLGVFDHLLPEESQHWVAPTFICELVSGEPIVQEPEKCKEVKWFSIEEAQNLPLSVITRADVAKLAQRLELAENCGDCQCGGNCECEDGCKSEDTCQCGGNCQCEGESKGGCQGQCGDCQCQS